VGDPGVAEAFKGAEMRGTLTEKNKNRKNSHSFD